MTTELGAWLRAAARGPRLVQADMARRLIHAGRDTGDRSLPDADVLGNYVHRWERGLITVLTERYVLLYCRALGIPPGRVRPPA